MDDPRRVDLSEALASLHRVLDDLGDRQRGRRLQERVEVATLEVLHDEIRRAALERAHVRDACDVLALDARGRASLAEEATDRLRARRGVRAAHELERHALLELQVRRDDHPAHAAFAEQPVNPVLAGEDRPRRERHRRGRRGDRAGGAHWQVPTG